MISVRSPFNDTMRDTSVTVVSTPSALANVRPGDAASAGAAVVVTTAAAVVLAAGATAVVVSVSSDEPQLAAKTASTTTREAIIRDFTWRTSLGDRQRVALRLVD